MPSKSSINIAIFSTYPNRYCGISNYVERIVSKLRYTSNIRIDNYTLINYTTSSPKSTEFNIRNPADCNKLVARIHKKKYNLLHFHYDHSLFNSIHNQQIHYLNFYFFVKSLSVPTIITLHHTFKYIQIFKFADFSKLNNVFFIVHSSYYKKKLIEQYPLLKNKIYYVPQGASKKLFALDQQEQKLFRDLKVKHNHFILLTAGFIAPWKRQLDLLRTLKETLQKYSHLEYIIIGSDIYNKNYFLQCQKFINENHLGNVTLINKFLSFSEYKVYLHLADVYLDAHETEHPSSASIVHAIMTRTLVIANLTLFTKCLYIRKSIIPVQKCTHIPALIKKITMQPHKYKKLFRHIDNLRKNSTWAVLAKKHQLIYKQISYTYDVSTHQSIIPLVFINYSPFITNLLKKNRFNDHVLQSYVKYIPIFILPNTKGNHHSILFSRLNKLIISIQVYFMSLFQIQLVKFQRIKHQALTKFTINKDIWISNQLTNFRFIRDALSIFYFLIFHSTNIVPTIIYQPGKVGSIAIKESLKRSGVRFVYQLHQLSPDNILTIRKQIRYKHAISFSLLGLIIFKYLISARRKINIITPIREPIGRNISAFFENLDYRSPFLEDSNLLKLKKTGIVQTKSHKELYNLFVSKYSQLLITDWFNREFKKTLSIDVYKLPFNKTRGYQLITKDNLRILLIKSNLDNNIKSRVISKFIHRKHIKITNMYQSKHKYYYKKMEKMLAHGLPQRLSSPLVTSRYYKHFF